MWFSDLCRATQLVIGRVTCIPGHCPFAWPNWTPNTAPGRVCSSFHVTCRLPARHSAMKSWEVMILSLVYSWGNSKEVMELHFRSPKLGTLPNHYATLRALKALQHQARAYCSAVTITTGNNPNLPFEMNSSSFEGKYLLRSLLRYHLWEDFPSSPYPRTLGSTVIDREVFCPLHKKYFKAKNHFWLFSSCPALGPSAPQVSGKVCWANG